MSGINSARKAATPGRDSARKVNATDSFSVRSKSKVPEPTLTMAGNQQLMRALGIRAKLSVSRPDDPEEREANRMADAVIGKSSTQLKCSACSSGTEEDSIQRSAKPASGAKAERDLRSAVATAEQGSGEPLSTATSSFFGTRLGQDFTDVRVHTDNRAAHSARAIAARAYTVGRDIVFGSGEYRPHAPAGRHLIAHELTHVLQQRASPGEQVLRRQILGENRPLTPTERVLLGDISTWSRSERISTVRAILSNWWVGPTDERALERLWGSFGTELGEVVMEADHMQLFRKSYDRGMEITELGIPSLEQDLEDFEREAVVRVLGVLQISEDEVRRELVRYGISWTVSHTHVSNYGGTATYLSQTRYHVGETPELAGLAAAAAQLLPLREKLVELKTELRRMENVRNRQSMGLPTPGSDRLQSYEWEMGLAPLRGEIRDKERQYEILRQQHEVRFPILAAFAERPDQDNRAALRTIAQSARDPDAAAKLLGSRVRKHLADIATTRRRINNESETIWKLPRVVNMTMAARGWSQGSFEELAVRARVDEAEADESFVDTVLGAIALGLGLLAAIPTGGSSLLATAAVVGATGSVVANTAIAARSISRYQLEAAAAGTAFDRARAISGSDPSLFWVALDIAGVILEIGPALRVFDGAAATIRGAMAAHPTRTVDDVGRVIRRLGRGEVADDQLDSLVRVLGRRIEEIRQGGGEGAVRFRQQLDEVEDAVRSGTTEAVEQSRPLRVIIEEHHHLNVSPGGLLIRCSDQCTIVRSFYQKELSENPGLLNRLDDVERALARGPADEALRRRARELMNDLKAARTRPIRSALGDAADLNRLLARDDLPAGMSDDFMEILLRTVSSEDFEAEWLGRMVQVLSRTEDLRIYANMLETRVRVSTRSANRVFHQEGSFYWTNMKNWEEMSMMEAQLRGYRPSAGRRAGPRAAGEPGELVSGSQTPSGAQATVIVGAPVQRQGFENILDTVGEVRAEIARQRAAGIIPDPQQVRTMERMVAMLSERLHASGAGFGIELTLGIAHGPQVVNQIFQNQGVEQLIRFLHATRPAGVKYRVTLDVVTQAAEDGRPMLRRITYRVEALETPVGAGPPREIRPMFEASISVPQGEIRTSPRITRGGQNIAVAGVELDVERGFGALAEHLGYGATTGPARGTGLASDLSHPVHLTPEDVARLDLHNLPTRELQGVDFRHADLRDVTLADANLVGTDFRGVDLTTTDLQGANLQGARLDGSRLPSAERMEGVILPDGEPFRMPLDLSRYTDRNHPNFFDPGVVPSLYLNDSVP